MATTALSCTRNRCGGRSVHLSCVLRRCVLRRCVCVCVCVRACGGVGLSLPRRRWLCRSSCRRASPLWMPRTRGHSLSRRCPRSSTRSVSLLRAVTRHTPRWLSTALMQRCAGGVALPLLRPHDRQRVPRDEHGVAAVAKPQVSFFVSHAIGPAPVASTFPGRGCRPQRVRTCGFVVVAGCSGSGCARSGRRGGDRGGRGSVSSLLPFLRHCCPLRLCHCSVASCAHASVSMRHVQHRWLACRVQEQGCLRRGAAGGAIESHGRR